MASISEIVTVASAVIGILGWLLSGGKDGEDERQHNHHSRSSEHSSDRNRTDNHPRPPPSNPSPSSFASSKPCQSPPIPSQSSNPSERNHTDRNHSHHASEHSSARNHTDNHPLLPPSNPSSSSFASSKPSQSFSNSSPKTTLGSSSLTSQPDRQVVQRYEIPKHLEAQINKDILPEILRWPLSPSTYAEYFATLLHAEDFYIEKWSEFLLSGLTLELQRRELYETRSRGNKEGNEIILVKKKPFVSFEIDAIPERRPYLLSRDFVFLKGSHKATGPFKIGVVRDSAATPETTIDNIELAMGLTQIAVGENRVSGKKEGEALVDHIEEEHPLFVGI